jgi:hypothetical protein
MNLNPWVYKAHYPGLAHPVLLSHSVTRRRQSPHSGTAAQRRAAGGGTSSPETAVRPRQNRGGWIQTRRRHPRKHHLSPPHQGWGRHLGPRLVVASLLVLRATRPRLKRLPLQHGPGEGGLTAQLEILGCSVGRSNFSRLVFASTEFQVAAPFCLSSRLLRSISFTENFGTICI